MKLPKVDEKFYQCTLPLSQKKVNFKPFNSKRQKQFLMEVENNDNDTTKAKIIFDIINECSSIEIDDLNSIDFDYLFFQIRKYAIGDDLLIRFKYKDKLKDKETNKEVETEEAVEVVINIDKDIKVQDVDLKNISTTIQYNDMTINFEQPKVKDFLESNDYKGDKYEYLKGTSLKSVEKNGEIYNDFILEDAIEFLNNLPPYIDNKIDDFINKNPRLFFDKKVKLNKFDKEIDLSKYNYTDFFLFF